MACTIVLHEEYPMPSALMADAAAPGGHGKCVAA